MKRFITILAFAFTVLALNAQELANFRRVSVVSPEVKNDTVTFRLRAEYATDVKLYGSWMPSYFDTAQLRRGENYIWEISIPAPAPEIYTYHFIVDGVAMNDPVNTLVQRDGTRYLSMLLIDGERSQNYREANKRGSVSHVWYDSELLGMNRRLTVYTPYGYETSKKTKYPVLYLLHGGGGRSAGPVLLHPGRGPAPRGSKRWADPGAEEAPCAHHEHRPGCGLRRVSGLSF